MNDYRVALRDLTETAEIFANAVRCAAMAAGGIDSPEADAAAQVAIAKCRATLLETLNDFPAMRIIYSVPPLR